MSTSTWRVDNFHVNIGNGDGSMHVLVYVPTNTAYRCILIDGGSAGLSVDPKTNQGSQSNPIKTMISRLTASYTWPNSRCQFDTIVISHWDEDHYGSLLKTIKEDAAAGQPINYLKYGGTNNTAPATYLYVPNWASGKRLNGAPASYVKAGSDGICSINIAASTKTMDVEPDWVPFAILRAADGKAPLSNLSSVLGAEFFFNTTCTAATNTIANLAALAKPGANPPALQQGKQNLPPSMYCIGVRQIALGPAMVGVIKESPTYTNRYSITCVLVWFNSDGSPKQVSHYLAGDADQVSEASYLAWLKRNTTNFGIKSVKLSHHGARSSTPLNLLRTANPSNVVMSLPSGMHIHPSWEVIYHVLLWKWSTAANPPPAILGTKYPHFLVAQGSGGSTSSTPNSFQYLKSGRVSIAALEKATKSPNTAYWADCNNMLATISANNDVQSLLEAYKAVKQQYNASESDMRMWITNILQQMWDNSCHPSRKSHPFVGASILPQAATITTNNQIDAVLIQSTPDDYDGRVFHLYRGTDTIAEYNSSTGQSTYSTAAVSSTQANSASGPSSPFQSNISSSSNNPAPMAPSSQGATSSAVADGFSFILPSAVVLPSGSFADPPGTDPNEDEDELVDKDMSDDDTTEDDTVSPVSNQGTSSTANDNGYYLFASTVPTTSITIAKTQYQTLIAGSPLNDFVSALHCGNLCLAGPNPPPTTPGSTTVLESSDEFSGYLTQALQTTELSVINATQPTTSLPIAGFAFATTAISGDATDKAVLSFTTAAVEDAFGLTKGTGPPLGILHHVKTLVFGLDRSAWTPPLVASATVAQLVQFANITFLEKSPALKVLGAETLTISVAPGSRNAIWFEPLSAYRTTTRLQMDLSDDACTSLNSYIGAFSGLTIDSASAIARRTCTWSPAPASATGNNASITYDGSLMFGAVITTTAKGTQFDAVIELLPAQIKLELVLRTKVDVLAEIFTLLAPVLDLAGTNFEFTNWLKPDNPAGNATFESFFLRRIVVVMDDDSSSKGGTSTRPGIASVQIDLETRVNFSTGKFAIFLVTYSWTREPGSPTGSTLVAGLWTAPDTLITGAAGYQLLPDYEEYSSLVPPVTLNPGETLPSSLSLADIGEFDGLPSEIQLAVTQATLTVGSGGISFSGDVIASSPGGNIPKLSLSELTLDASYMFNSGGFTGSLLVKAMISAPAGVQNGSNTQITGEIYKGKDGWHLGAVVNGLYGSSLFQFFDSDVQSGIGSVLDNLEISTLGIQYDYTPSGTGSSMAVAASSFNIMGDISFGSLLLKLTFTYQTTTPTKPPWQFTATFGEKDPPPGTKLRDVLTHIFGSEIEDDLSAFPFILDIPVEPPATNDIGFDLVPMAGPAGSSDNGLLFTAWLNFEGMDFQAIQYQAPSVSSSSGGKTQTQRPPPWRVFTMAVTSLPPVNIPLIGDLTQPFDEMLVMYVQPQSGNSAAAGITHGEVKIINTKMEQDAVASGRTPTPLQYQATKAKDQYQDSDVVLHVGAHFILVLKDKQGKPDVTLDYLFYNPASTPSASKALVSKSSAPTTGSTAEGEAPAKSKTLGDGDSTTLAAPGDDSGASDDSSATPGAAKAPYQKKMGPLTISNMGFKFGGGSKDPTLSIIMDASVVLGPIGLGLMGFSLDLEFSKGITLFQLPVPRVSLSGLAASFDKPPVLLAGLLEHVVTASENYYEGAVTLSFSPYQFGAGGYYGTTTTNAGTHFKSAFVYFLLNGPLVTLEFAEIDGVTGGFGYNSNLQFPTVANVEQFPLLAGASTMPTDPNAALASLMNTSWFFPQDGSFWLAAGLSVKALELLQASVVVVIEWNPAITLGLFGVATADMPAGNKDEDKLVHVELGLTATFDFNSGQLKIEGQLAPSSFVLNPACHLTGGFAFYQWFGGDDSNSSSGDFVFTVGGYHRGFNPPAQYPSVPRLAINWSYDSSLSITGESYFALTPNVCMAGGRLDASLSLGPLSAWFDAYADMLINFKPFFFSADGAISVGVAFTLDLWICTIHISCEIGATLHLQGPPISGTVHVNFWVFGFSIDFGDSSSGSDSPLLLTDFYKLALQGDLSKSVSSSSSSPATLPTDADAPDPSLPPAHVYTCNEGLIPTGQSNSDPNSSTEAWNVRGAVFQFTVGCKFAIYSATIITAQADSSDPPLPPYNVPLTGGGPVYARPMQLTQPLASDLTVTITPPAKTQPTQPLWDIGAGVVKSMPKALWGIYSADNDPLSPNNSAPDPNRSPNLLNPDNASGPGSATSTLTPLIMGLTLCSPAPQLSKDMIPAFAYDTFLIRDVGPSGNGYPFPVVDAPADAEWYPAPTPPDLTTEWDLVREQWGGTPGLGVDAGPVAVAMWAGLSFAGWQGVGTSTPGVISGAAPTGLLLASEDSFDSMYLDAPRMTVSVGAA